MTGFGSAEKEGFRVEVRSLNHRFLETTVKMPSALLRHELAVRDEIKKRFDRGRFDVFVSTIGAGKVKLSINKAFADELFETLHSLKEELALQGHLSLETMMAWKDMVITEKVEYNDSALFDALDTALQEVETMRYKEGESIKTAMLESAERMSAFNQEVRALVPQAVEFARSKFQEKVRLVLSQDMAVDENKILFEASRASEKADITEELNRTDGHLVQLKETLQAGGKIGRRLDFLLQELYRESNTIASKAEVRDIIKVAVEMKAETESMREQVQNIQ